MYHGNADDLLLHPGLCLAGEDIARDYAEYASSREGRVHQVEISFGGLEVVELDEGHDWDANTAPGDAGEVYRSEDGTVADVIIFDDATASGRRHETYRLMTEKALAAVAVTGCEMIAGDDE